MSKKAILGKVGLGVAVLALPLVFLVPYYRSVTEEYQRFNDYMLETVDNPDVPPVWESEVLSPVQCVDFGIEWVEACQGTKEFCFGGLSAVVNRCVQSQDRAAYCVALEHEWMTTGYGYHDCEARKAQVESSKQRNREKVCAASYRAIADHCRDLELAE